MFCLDKLVRRKTTSVTVVDKGTETQITDNTNRPLRRYLLVNPFGRVSLFYKALSEFSSFFKR